ncbi:hypothetical protein PV396_37565 [Streptomyces sp. ME02-8801-2C]|uniref:hypothetical protein n=1 Tax=Streptomyces sp. ME02-8801-2C TaxID=3028680 RepID=UPI0029B17E5C|nr:hypothetical protein [Streptomyces sp. ME02-8801-2C]MDX3457598.1 hypothetical protein [Streptomyces sp. ME02-8801-2C]
MGVPDSPRQDASWTAAAPGLVRGVVPERATLDPVHHDAGHTPEWRPPAPTDVSPVDPSPSGTLPRRGPVDEPADRLADLVRPPVR